MNWNKFSVPQSYDMGQEKLTPQETNVLLNCKSKAIKDFTVGACVGGGISWIATRRLTTFLRINLSVGGAFITGMARFSRSFDSCINHILSWDGSRMQIELANIIARKYRDHPSWMQYISKHFYLEEVFDDSTLDQPNLRWRHRNFYVESAAHSERTVEKHSQSNSDSEQTDMAPTKVYMNPRISMMADPLDCIFGNPTREEIKRPDTPSTKPRMLSRSHKRSHRRHQKHHQEVSLNPQHAQPHA